MEKTFGWNHRRAGLLDGLRLALKNLQIANCSAVFVDGSFVTDKEHPLDIDCCYDGTGIDEDVLDEEFFQFEYGRSAQKLKWGCEFFVVDGDADHEGTPFLEFFQTSREGEAKGIVQLDPRNCEGL